MTFWRENGSSRVAIGLAIEATHRVAAALAGPAGGLPGEFRGRDKLGSPTGDYGRDSRRDRGQLFRGRLRCDRNHHGRLPLAHSGMFPCLRRGVATRFDRASARDLISHGRVVRGEITSSIYPRDAAW